MLRLAFDFIITWRETRTRPNAYLHKAWQVFKLKIKMRAGIVQFFYLKSSTGELRQAFGTLKDDLCPETKGDDRKPNKHLVTYYDTVAEGWRSFRMFNFVKVI